MVVEPLWKSDGNWDVKLLLLFLIFKLFLTLKGFSLYKPQTISIYGLLTKNNHKILVLNQCTGWISGILYPIPIGVIFCREVKFTKGLNCSRGGW